MDGVDGREGVNVALKILHTADWHLGLRFPAVTPEQEKRLTRARLEVVGRILDLAESRGVDAVLCAGDLFDEPLPEEEWWQGLLSEFGRRSWTRPVVLLPGNHDPLTPNSIYAPGSPFRRALPRIRSRGRFRRVRAADRVCRGRVCAAVSVACGSDRFGGQPPGACRRRRADPHRAHSRPDLRPPGSSDHVPDSTQRGGSERGLDYLAIGDTHGLSRRGAGCQGSDHLSGGTRSNQVRGGRLPATSPWSSFRATGRDALWSTAKRLQPGRGGKRPAVSLAELRRLRDVRT